MKNLRKNTLQVALLTSLFMMFLFTDDSFNEKTVHARLGYFIGQEYEPNLKVHGVKIFVDDLSKAKVFYNSFLGLEVAQETPSSIKLTTGQYPLYLIKAEEHVPRQVLTESHYGISFLTSKLLPAIDVAREFGVTIYDTLLSRNGIGIHIPISDPSGNLLHLMEVQTRSIPGFEGFRLYNSGTTTNNMSIAERFYIDALGFQDWSRNYLPDALPLKDAAGNFAFMLHLDKNLELSSYEYGNSPGVVLTLKVDELKEFASFLASKNLAHETKDEVILISDSHNNTIEIIEGP